MYKLALLLLSTSVFSLGSPHSSSALDEKIRVLDEKIRQQEKQHMTNDTELKVLVDEYNELIQQKASAEGQTHTAEPQSLDEAMLHRQMQAENRLELLERRIEAVELKLGITRPTPGTQPSIADRTTTIEEKVSALQPTDPSAPAAITTNVPSKHAPDDVATVQAETSQEQVPGKAQSPAVAQYNQAMSFLRTGTKDNAEKAIEAFETVINTYPDDEFAHKSYVHAGTASMLLNHAEHAQAYFKTALTKPLPETLAVDARLGLAQAYLAQAVTTSLGKAQLDLLKKQPMSQEQKSKYVELIKKYSSLPTKQAAPKSIH